MYFEISIAWLIIVTIPVSLLYVLIIIALLYNRKTVPFDSTYFSLWINLGVADLLMVIFSWIFTNTRTLDVWPNGYSNVRGNIKK
jgi:hypothetical protein